MSPATTGVMAVETLKRYGAFQRSWPSAAPTETKPLCVKKITCFAPRRVATTGVECVIFSSCDFHATAPVSLLNARNDWPGPPPAT